MEPSARPSGRARGFILCPPQGSSRVKVQAARTKGEGPEGMRVRTLKPDRKRARDYHLMEPTTSIQKGCYVSETREPVLCFLTICIPDINRSRYYIINRRGGFQVIPRRRPAQRVNLRALQFCPLRLSNILQHRRRVATPVTIKKWGRGKVRSWGIESRQGKDEDSI
jgi:hypothetical protein